MAERLPDLMTAEETSGYTGLAVQTLANQRSRGVGLPYVRLPGGRIRYPRRAVQEYLDAHTVIPEGAA